MSNNKIFLPYSGIFVEPVLKPIAPSAIFIANSVAVGAGIAAAPLLPFVATVYASKRLFFDPFQEISSNEGRLKFLNEQRKQDLEKRVSEIENKIFSPEFSSQPWHKRLSDKFERFSARTHLAIEKMPLVFRGATKAALRVAEITAVIGAAVGLAATAAATAGIAAVALVAAPTAAFATASHFLDPSNKNYKEHKARFDNYVEAQSIEKLREAQHQHARELVMADVEIQGLSEQEKTQLLEEADRQFGPQLTREEALARDHQIEEEIENIDPSMHIANRDINPELRKVLEGIAYDYLTHLDDEMYHGLDAEMWRIKTTYVYALKASEGIDHGLTRDEIRKLYKEIEDWIAESLEQERSAAVSVNETINAVSPEVVTPVPIQDNGSRVQATIHSAREQAVQPQSQQVQRGLGN